MRSELADLELQRAEAEGQLQQLQEVRARGAPDLGWGLPISISPPLPSPVFPQEGRVHSIYNSRTEGETDLEGSKAPTLE